MAYFDTWLGTNANASTTGHYAVPQWVQTPLIHRQMVRQLATPAVGSERVFVALGSGTTNAATEPTWVVTRGGKTGDGTVTWQECTGAPALNGDPSNTPNWNRDSLGSKAITLGQVIVNSAQTFVFICSLAGTNGAGEPTWVTTAGQATTSGSTQWMCLGPISAFADAAPHARVGTHRR
jgi:hypothetical protein